MARWCGTVAATRRVRPARNTLPSAPTSHDATVGTGTGFRSSPCGSTTFARVFTEHARRHAWPDAMPLVVPAADPAAPSDARRTADGHWSTT